MLRKAVSLSISVAMLPLFFALAIVARWWPRRVAAGFGPEPLINHILHVKALRLKGWTAESFVSSVYYITQNFDYRVDGWKVPSLFKNSWLFVRAIFRYRTLFIYFNGGPLGFTALWRFEPSLLKLAGVKVIVMPYGSDVQNMDHCPNLLYKQVYATHYFNYQRAHREITQKKINQWCKAADHILCGCEWVDFVPYWNTLVGAHFTVEMQEQIAPKWTPGKPLKVFHATNHPGIKGTTFIEKAVESLQQQGYAIELDLVKNTPNTEVLSRLKSADVVIDQVIIGWYGLFSLEAMAHGKPVICYLRPDLLELHAMAGTFATEIPIISSQFTELEKTLKGILLGEVDLQGLSDRSYDFVNRHHSVEAMGNVLSQMLIEVGAK